MSMREVLVDVINHTQGLGVIDEVKFSQENSNTIVEAMDDKGYAVIKGTLKDGHGEPFTGEFGIINLTTLKGLLDFANFKTDNATMEIATVARNSTQVPDRIVFTDDQGQSFHHRLRAPELCKEYFAFTGATWTIQFTPSRNKVKEFSYMSSLYSGLTPNFSVSTEDSKLLFNIGENGGGSLIMDDTDVEFKNSHSWNIALVLGALKMDEGNAEVSILDNQRNAILQVVVETQYATWQYIFPDIYE